MGERDVILRAFARTEKQKTRALRRKGQLPAVFYGSHFSPKKLYCSLHDFQRVFDQVRMTHLFTLEIDGAQETALIREIQRHPITGAFLHIDFLRVLQDQPITSIVPIALVGHAPATEKGGILSHLLTEVEVECLPQDLPDEVAADISSLRDYGDFLTVQDLSIPPRVTMLTPLEAEVVRILAPRVYEKEEQPQPSREAFPAKEPTSSASEH